MIQCFRRSRFLKHFSDMVVAILNFWIISICKICKGPSDVQFWFNQVCSFYQKKKASIHFPIGSYVKLLSAVVVILDFQMLKICTFWRGQFKEHTIFYSKSLNSFWTNEIFILSQSNNIISSGNQAKILNFAPK
jgi:hypothetical protein